jgi:hypothetical protein
MPLFNAMVVIHYQIKGINFFLFFGYLSLNSVKYQACVATERGIKLLQLTKKTNNPLTFQCIIAYPSQASNSVGERDGEERGEVD